MSWKNIKVDVLASGQPRAYADSQYVARITFTQNDWHTWAKSGDTLPLRADRYDAVAIFKQQVRSEAIERDDPNANWASCMFTDVHEEAPGVWYVAAVAAFTD